MNQSDAPLHNIPAWSDGVWLRTRSGPTARANSTRVDVSLWHRIRDLNGFMSRARTACGYGPRDGFTWPNGGSRWEIARPQVYGTLPGAVCERCRMAPARSESEAESEHLIPDVPDIEELARLVADRLTAALPVKEGEPEHG